MPYSVDYYYSTTGEQILASNDPVKLIHTVSSDRDKGSILVYENPGEYLWLGKHYWIDTEDNKIYFDPNTVGNNITIKYLRLIPDEPSNR